MNVLIVRASEDARRSAAHMRAKGIGAIIAPAIEIVAIEANIPDGAFDAIIATSAHAFGALARSISALKQMRVLVVGARTAEAAVASGLRTPETVAPNAQALVAALALRFPERARLLYLAGRDRKPDLEGALSRMHHLRLLETYAAEATKALPAEAVEALRNGAVGAVLHYSRRSAEIFLGLVSAASLHDAIAPLLHVAISADAAAPLLATGLRVAIAATPDEDSMIEALDN